MFVSGSVAGTKGSSNGSLPWMKGKMKVRRRLQFPNHGIFGSRASSVSEHCDLSGGNLGRGRRSGHDNCGGWPSDSRFGLSKRGPRGVERLDLSVSNVQHQTRRGELSIDRRPGPYCGNDQTVLEFSAMETQ